MCDRGFQDIESESLLVENVEKMGIELDRIDHSFLTDKKDVIVKIVGSTSSDSYV